MDQTGIGVEGRTDEVGEELPWSYLVAPTHVRTPEEVAQWLEGDVRDLLEIAMQLVRPRAYGGDAQAAPVDPSLVWAILQDAYCVTIAAAEALRGVRPVDGDGDRWRHFARFISEANRIGLDESGYPRLVSLLRAAAEADARSRSLGHAQGAEVAA